MEDITIIGGGLMGSATAWQLAKAGQKVLLLEKQGENYSTGSSFGEARISRSLGPKGDIFSYLQQTSIAATKELIHFLNEADGESGHDMEDIYRTSPVTYLYYESQQEAIVQLLQDQQDKIEFADNQEKALTLFNMIVPEQAKVIREYKQYSGTLNPRILIEKLQHGVALKAGKTTYDKEVVSLKRKDDHYKLQTVDLRTGKTNTFFSRKVVAAAGPYNNHLVKNLAPYFSKLITPKRLSLAFLKIKEKTYEKLSQEEKQRLRVSLPFAEMSTPIFYAMIEEFTEEGIPVFKVGGHQRRSAIDDLDQVWSKALDQREIEWSRENLVRYFQMLNLPVELSDLEFVRGYSCVYSLTESEIPYVTQINQDNNEIDPNFLFLGGMSGVGAKGALAYGLITANLLLGKDDVSSMYQKTKLALGIQRFIDDVSIFSA